MCIKVSPSTRVTSFNGRYDSIDYSADLKPPFENADATWVNDLLKLAGRR